MVEYYYYKGTCDQIGRMLMSIAAIKGVAKYSTVGFLVLLMYFFYPLINLIMFWVNYNTWPVAYEFFILIFYVAGNGLIKPYRPDAFATIRSIF